MRTPASAFAQAASPAFRYSQHPFCWFRMDLCSVHSSDSSPSMPPFPGRAAAVIPSLSWKFRFCAQPPEQSAAVAFIQLLRSHSDVQSFIPGRGPRSVAAPLTLLAIAAAKTRT